MIAGATADPPSAHLLIVDDEADFAAFLADVAGGLGYRCTIATDLARFEAALGEPIDLIMLDLMMPGADGVELLRRLAALGHRAGVVLMSGFDRRVLASAEALAGELGLQVRGHLGKPVRAAELENFLLSLPMGADQRRQAPDAAEPLQAGELEDAIRDDQFEIHYQPQLAVTGGRLVGIEALVRWRHPTAGLVYPDRFIDLAERIGVIDELTWIVGARAMTDCRTLTDAFGPLHLSINVSTSSLSDLSMPDRLQWMAAERGLPPHLLVIEVTENRLMRDLAPALDILTRLRMKGMGVSIDDFGTGYSTMEQLRRVPATEVKIDRSFVIGSDADDSARLIVEKTIEIGHRLDMRVVAEGVETAGQLRMLGGLGCDLAQGYLFSRPLPLASLIEWISARVVRPGQTAVPVAGS